MRIKLEIKRVGQHQEFEFRREQPDGSYSLQYYPAIANKDLTPGLTLDTHGMDPETIDQFRNDMNDFINCPY
jgi:hypothetical protein